MSSRYKIIIVVAAFLTMHITTPLKAQIQELVPYGDFEQWVVHDVKESRIIGGKTERLYEIDATDTLEVNTPFTPKKGSIWATSNAYAKIAGITKASVTVYPEQGIHGYCAKLTTQYAECKVLGVVNIRVLVSGCLYWGYMPEPITGASNPYGRMSWGIPYTKHPKYFVLDYKSSMPHKGTITKCNVTSESTRSGNDEQEVMFILQNRHEGADGKIYATRVGTAIYHITDATDDWVEDYHIPVIYGDARKSPHFKPYMDLGPMKDNIYGLNSKGENVEIIENAWGDENTPVTHAVLKITASIQEAYSGTIGNTLWIDNVKLEY